MTVAFFFSTPGPLEIVVFSLLLILCITVVRRLKGKNTLDRLDYNQANQQQQELEKKRSKKK